MAVPRKRMPKPARRYDIYLPLTFNDQRLVPESKFFAVEHRLLSHFGGVTTSQREFPLRGVWASEAEVYLDQVVIVTALDFRRRGSTAFISQLKLDLLREF